MEAWPLPTQGGLALTSPALGWSSELELSCWTQVPAGVRYESAGLGPDFSQGSPAYVEVTLETPGPHP